jgi:hypothetical protein
MRFSRPRVIRPAHEAPRALSIHYRWRITRPGPGGHRRRAAGRVAGGRVVFGRTARPPDAGIRARRTDDHRAGPDRVVERSPQRGNAGLAGGHADRQPRLGQLAGRHGPRGHSGGTPPPAGDAPQARPRRPGRRAQVRPGRRAGHSRARQRPGNRGTRRGGRARAPGCRSAGSGRRAPTRSRPRSTTPRTVPPFACSIPPPRRP